MREETTQYFLSTEGSLLKVATMIYLRGEFKMSHFPPLAFLGSIAPSGAERGRAERLRTQTQGIPSEPNYAANPRGA